MQCKDEKFLYYGGLLKNLIFRSQGVHKNQYLGGNYLKRGALDTLQIQGGELDQKEGAVFLRGIQYPNEHYVIFRSPCNHSAVTRLENVCQLKKR